MTLVMPTVHVSEQNVYYNEIILDKELRRFRIKIRSNNYVSQSRSEIELWSDKGWIEVYSIPGELMKTKASYADRTIATAEAFKEDRNKLIRTAKRILGI